jgi:hypothetical protein
MATLPIDMPRIEKSERLTASLSDQRLSIQGPYFDALFFWGAPVLSLIFVQVWLGTALAFPKAMADHLANILVVLSVLITYAHLIAVVPRAYLNREVFGANRIRLTVVPVALVTAFVWSPTLMAIGAVVGIFWDIHHSAMQSFGLSRIYDMKAGNDVQQLRRVDMRLNWVLYVGPLVAGAAFSTHIDTLRQLDHVGLSDIARLPSILESHVSFFSAIAITAWVFMVGWAMLEYRKAMLLGYRLPAHKLVLLICTGLVSVLAWGFLSPLVALVSINIYHAVQYFALVWLKEGRRMTAFTGVKPRLAFDLFIGGCAVLGVAYHFASSANIGWLLAPFIACSLLHFWYDGFIWSVRKKQI